MAESSRLSQDDKILRAYAKSLQSSSPFILLYKDTTYFLLLTQYGSRDSYFSSSW
jgi:hypothetical protein